MFSFSKFAVVFATTAALARASVTPVKARDVYTITYPDSTTVWNVGETHNVTWTAPYDGTGRLFITNDMSNFGSPLVTDIDADAETVTITVPDLIDGTYYVIIDFDGTSATSAPFGIGESVTVTGSPTVLSTIWYPSASYSGVVYASAYYSSVVYSSSPASTTPSTTVSTPSTTSKVATSTATGSTTSTSSASSSTASASISISNSAAGRFRSAFGYGPMLMTLGFITMVMFNC
ncbi:hypothetical protein FISHEDRAFT_75551 [Fistulina hepatica ATCC 64428]|uniref:Ser-Thr-rich glycosyl-phosphatidyl-inositol-anchored membrane family-domain-containing protein n=1 Tax=Fistulina hepatica ATCC 64428 TaxID=1128425 RepID=A0A0D7A6U6_9AGAR|nr:hypothetical protein FISHEDRAFT_75551 [Fistulina hepatica ATCC 64428]